LIYNNLQGCPEKVRKTGDAVRDFDFGLTKSTALICRSLSSALFKLNLIANNTNN